MAAMAATTAKSAVNVVWHKCTDLRVHDNECISLAHADGREVIHVFCFDPFWWKRLPLTGYTKTGKRACASQFLRVKPERERR
jgi:deoxyribodipyrimidine photolyase